jgi:hypothetical protein
MERDTLIASSIAAVFFALIFLGLVLRVMRRVRSAPDHAPKRSRAKKPVIIIDGSNVMYWDAGTPNIATVRKVVIALRAYGYDVGVMFDANAGHLLVGKYQHDRAMAEALGLREAAIMVVPKGTPADPYILKAARDMNAQIVTNDKFRDWASDYPEVRRDGHLIKGRCHNGALELKLGPPPKFLQNPIS